MAEFVSAFRIQGFDRHAAPSRWQMVPTTGVRYVILRQGAGLTVSSRNTGICTVEEVRDADLPADDRQPFAVGDRFFRLRGKAHGSTFIDAKSGAAVTVSLEASVKNLKTVKVKFNFVRDNAAHKTIRVPADVNRQFATACWMYREQLNVKLESLGTRWVDVAQNLGAVVRFSSHLAGVPAAEHEWGVVTALRDAAADLNVFFVWEYEQDLTPATDDTNAGTMGGNCIFEDDIGAGIPMWRTLSHEIGHHLGVDDHYDAAKKYELMYGRSDRGIHVPKGHADIMNP
ncbi:MAG: hypothetical protein HY235_06855 [Acidobacteria bacterium]|nr:hypothetical protein [Acidobacteriota bacterium]